MKALFVLLFLLCFTDGHSQTYGYFGKKNVLTINGTGCMPMTYWFLRRAPNYKWTGNSLTQGNDFFDGGFVASISHAFSGNFGLGFEYAMTFGNMAGPQEATVTFNYGQSGYSYTENVDIRHEQLKIQTMSFLPKIEYTFLGDQMPIGINNQFGVGFSTTKVIEDDYEVKPVFNGYNNPETAESFDEDKVLNFSKLKPVNGMTLLYAFNVRTPISRNLLLNYGIRYTLNLDFTELTSYTTPSSTQGYYVHSNEIQRLISNKRLSSIIMLNFGINYVF